MSMRVLACAKVNLTLEVLGKRPDGYHEAATVLHSIGLADELRFEPHDSLILAGDSAGAPGEANLALKAGRALQAALGERRGARITLRKRIAVAAGLGGGSSDAAATLAGLARLWERDVPKKDLERIAAGLGSDVPFFLTGGAALGEGRGERITPLPPLRDTWLVVAPASLDATGKTGKLYAALTPASYTKGEATQRVAAALRAGRPVTSASLCNVFESVAAMVYPGYEQRRRAFLEAGAVAAHLAGSGPSLFALAAGQEDGERIAAGLRARDIAASVVKAVASSYNFV